MLSIVRLALAGLSICAASISTSSALAAQTTNLSFKVKIEDSGEWLSAPTPGVETYGARFRIDGQLGEWVRLGMDAIRFEGVQGPDWMQPSAATNMDTYFSSAIWTPHPLTAQVALMPERFAYGFALGIFNPAIVTDAHHNAVQDWYVPILSQSGDRRVWDSQPDMWKQGNQTGLGFSRFSRGYWRSLSREYWFGDSTSDEFLVDAMFRNALMLRALASPQFTGNPNGAIAAANAYLASAEFAQAATVGNIALVLQVTGLRVDGPILFDFFRDVDAPTLGAPRGGDGPLKDWPLTPPVGRITQSMCMPLILAPPAKGLTDRAWDENDISGIPTTITVNSPFYFHGANLLPPVRVGFKRADGPGHIFVTAVPDITRSQCLRHGVTPPQGSAPGTVVLKTGWDPTEVYTIGEVQAVLF